MFKLNDYVTTEFAGGVGKIVDVDNNGARFRVSWIEEPTLNSYRLIPLRIAKTKLWKYLYEEI